MLLKGPCPTPDESRRGAHALVTLPRYADVPAGTPGVLGLGWEPLLSGQVVDLTGDLAGDLVDDLLGGLAIGVDLVVGDFPV